MTDDNKNRVELTDEDRERIASCLSKTLDYYKELPESCLKCGEHEVCLTITSNVDMTEKGGGD